MNAIACPDRDALEAYLLGKIDDGAIDAHLNECADCQAALDTLDAAVNGPFACLRQAAPTSADWQPPYQLIARAEGLFEATVDLDDIETKGRRLPFQVGDYLLLELVAQSGMGQVYKAQHVHLKKTVAVKLIAPWLVRSSAGRQRFRREMEAVGRLDSPHIVTAFDAGEADGVDFLVMEYLDGSTLAELVRKDGPLPIPQALAYLLQAARGLAVAHAAGIIHRDVKPANLMLAAAGTVKVLDLGLAMLPFQEADFGDCGGPIGTPAYIAPEQALDVNAVDERTDVYGLAGTLHFLLTGHPPYWPDQGLALLNALRDKPVPSLRAARPDCPRALDALFRRMLAKDPKDRPASMREVVTELERLQKPRRTFGWRGLIAASVVLAASALVACAFWAAGGISGEQKKDKQDEVAQPKKGAKPAIDLVRIAGGEFWMGGSDSDPRAKPTEKPRRKVKINRAFFLGKTEVTQAEYEEVIGSNPSAFSAKGPNKARVKDLDTSKHPVESVSWLDAVRFCNRLSERHELKTYYKIDGEVVTIRGGDGYRLPTEAEWEYACRAGTTTTWSFGEKIADLKDHAWFAENSDDRTHPVAQKMANPWGLHDMYGNVPEWCWDRYDERYYAYMPASDPPGSGTGRLRVFRGDGWNSAGPRTPAREGLGFTYGGKGSINIVGFRVARNAEP
jgi:formylglycine-generating enzyme required for sulfatase activity